MQNQDTYSERPWGHYIKLYQECGVWVKRVEVKSGQRLSLQKHARRSEKWNIVTGTGLAIVNGQEIRLKPGTMVDVPLGAVHRICNTGSGKLVFIEVACGEYLGEDDIIRMEDDYARGPGA
jgi:mannose-6-phosphate isomerase